MFNVRHSWVLLAAGVFLASCSKDDDTEEIGNWISRSSLEGVARGEAVSFVIDNKAYIGTGYDGTNRLKDFWYYDQTSNSWTQVADLPGAARNSAVAFAVNGLGYVTTGYDGVNKLNDTWVYTPATDKWEPGVPFAGTARYSATAFGVAGKGYVTCGYDGNYLKDFYSFDPASQSWSKEESFSGNKRSDAVAFVINDKAYVVTGSNPNTGQTLSVNDMYMFDPASTAANKWTEKRKISNVSDEDYDNDYDMVSSNGVAFVMNNKGYIATGSKSGLTTNVWEYDPINDVWDQKRSFEGLARSGAIAFSINNRGYVGLGNSASLPFEDLWEFDPTATYNEND
ncbi:kelch repeat-containing protein [uncultured Chitinophaga sp.]|uniref:Kelch repeat-containing protein n=1 Tax=uncultured Chitinophaga sp. TaxID=339340 RepID=UPI0025E32FAE|nr:kelch repeat-containing protein [uncultured Chitinophaga sp.]